MVIDLFSDDSFRMRSGEEKIEKTGKLRWSLPAAQRIGPERDGPYLRREGEHIGGAAKRGMHIAHMSIFSIPPAERKGVIACPPS